MKNTLLFLFAALAWSATALCQTPADSAARPRKRVFIAHRGVNMRSTVAGENSLEAIRLAKAAGFGAIETDVRLSADGALVVMHDSTLNRTCLHADGTPLSEPVAVAGKTLRELRSDYILKAADPARRTRIPTLEEYLAECARNGLYTFIEPKLYDPTGRHYRDIIAAADAALGRDRYVVTSNNRANDVIRRTGIDDVRLMGILYQTTTSISSRPISWRPTTAGRAGCSPSTHGPTGSCSPHRPARARSVSARGRASSRNGSCPPYPSAPSTWKWKPKAAPASSWAAKPSRSTSPTSAPSRTRCCSTTPHLPCASRRSPEGSPSRRYGRRS